MGLLSKIKRVSSINCDDDESWIIYTDIYKMFVYNPVFFVGQDGLAVPLTEVMAEGVKDVDVCVDDSSMDYIVLYLKTGESISISIKSDDYTGPEAIYCVPNLAGGPHVVVGLHIQNPLQLSNRDRQDCTAPKKTVIE